MASKCVSKCASKCGYKGPGYASPSDAIKGPKEKLLYVTCASAEPDKTADVLAVVDVDPESQTYSKIVSKLFLPNLGDEVHHMGWNACSSCFGCAGIKRSHLVLPCLNSSRIYIINVEDPKNLKITRTIEPEELKAVDTSFPHTIHCLPDGIMVSTLGDANGNNKGDFILIDNATFKVKATWGEKVTFGYDFWYQPRINLMISTEWGTPNKLRNGFNPEDVKAGDYGNHVNVYNWKEKKVIQKIVLEGPQGFIPLEVRFKHEPSSPHAFAATALGSTLYHFHQPDVNTEKLDHRVAVSIPPKKVKNWALDSMPALITDIVISMDDNYIFLSCWLHGDIRMYDISDPFNVKLVGQVFIGGSIHKESGIVVLEDSELNSQPDLLYVNGKKIDGGPQMLQISLDGKRLYVTTSLYRTWDKQFYPDLIKNGAVLLKIDVENDPAAQLKNRLSLDTNFYVNITEQIGSSVPYLAHEMRYPGGDCTSDIWL